MAGSRIRYGMAIAALVAASCLLYIAPLVPQAVIDGVLVTNGEEPSRMVRATLTLLGGRDFVASNLWFPAIIFVALTALAGAATYLRGRWAAMAAEGIVRRLRDRVYDHLQRLPCEYFDEAETGDLLQRCTSDVDTLRIFLANQVVEIGRALIMFVVPLPLMWAIDPRMTAVSVVMIPLITGFSFVFFLKVRSAFREKDEAESAMTTVVQENLTGIRVVRAFARQDHEIAKFSDRNATHRVLDNKLYQLMAVYWSVSDLMAMFQKVLVLGAGIYWMSQGTLAVGAFFYFLTAVGMFIYPLRQMGRIVADLGKATVALERLREILDVLEEPAGGVDAARESEAIELVNVTFGYGTEPVIRDISLRIEPRSTVAFVGPSGSGKSTLVALLLRFYDPDSGAIRIGGKDLKALDRFDLRKRIAAVMQQPFLFSKSLAKNLALGRKDAPLADVIEATQTADVHATITDFDDGYDTFVGERGVTLSGGQRQRVALARALLQEAPVLILDDSLSAVDTETERAILQRLAERRGRQTTIIIAHRLSTVALADQIFVLDDGRVVESGDHETLLRKRGTYARLWNIQTEDKGFGQSIQ